MCLAHSLFLIPSISYVVRFPSSKANTTLIALLQLFLYLLSFYLSLTLLLLFLLLLF